MGSGQIISAPENIPGWAQLGAPVSGQAYVRGSTGWTLKTPVLEDGSYADPAWITSLAASKVGLGNVENTALSTWAGSTNIATVGVVGAGAWHATAVSEAYGGTNQTAYALGDTLYASAANTLAKLSGNITTTKKILSQTGDGTNSAAPAWTSTTGTGSVVLATSPTLFAPVLGSATATSINKVQLTAPATGAAIAITNLKTFSVSNTLTLAGTDSSTLDIGAGGTLGTAAYTASSAYEVPLAFSTGLTRTTNTITLTSPVTNVLGGTGFTTYATGDLLYASAANTLSKLAGNTTATLNVLTQTGDGANSAAVAWLATTGTGNVARATSPVFVTPTLGVASATTVNKVTLTAPAAGSTLTVADGKTLTASNTLTFAGTDGSTLNVGTGGTLGTAAYTAASAYEVPLAFGSGVSRSVNAVSLDQTFAATITGKWIFQKTTTPLQVGYDGSNYWTQTVGSTGGLTLAGTGMGGSLTLAPTAGKSVLIGNAAAASAGALSLTGVRNTGQTGTTSFGTLDLNESTATASTTLSTGGTGLRINLHGSGGNFIDLQQDGVSYLSASVAGSFVMPNNTSSAITAQFGNFGAQSVSDFNGYFAQNLYFDGSNPRYRKTGTSAQFQFVNGGIYFGLCASGTAGNIATIVYPIQLLAGASANSLVVNSTGNILLNTLTDLGSTAGLLQLRPVASGKGLAIVQNATTPGDFFTLYASDGTTVKAKTDSAGICTFTHSLGGGSAPSIAAGTGAGTSPTVSVTGTDSAGVISVTTGTLPTLSAAVVTLTYALAYGAAPYVVFTPANANAAALSGLSMVYITSNAGNFLLNAGATALTAGTTYNWNFIVKG